MASKMNEVYLRSDIVEQVRQQFVSNKTIPSVHLHEFLDNKFYATLRKEILRLKLKEEIYRLSHKYQIGQVTGEMKSLFNDTDLLSFVSFIIGKKAKGIDASCIVFGSGDYTVLHDAKILDRPRTLVRSESWTSKNPKQTQGFFDLGKEKSGIDFVLDLTEDWDNNAGGQIVYTENKGDGLVVNATGNSLLLVQRKNMHVRKFVKYVNHRAGKNKRLLVMGKIGI